MVVAFDLGGMKWRIWLLPLRLISDSRLTHIMREHGRFVRSFRRSRYVCCLLVLGLAVKSKVWLVVALVVLAKVWLVALCPAAWRSSGESLVWWAY